MRHESMRGWFAYYLLEAARQDKKIVVVTADLGYGMWDSFKSELPGQFFNVGASEQLAAGVCVGLALAGFKPFFYSITTFGLYRPFEWWRNYANRENIPVRICLAGRNRDYAHDGFSHWSEDAKEVLNLWPNINQFWPKEKENIPLLVDFMVNENQPTFISLRR